MNNRLRLLRKALFHFFFFGMMAAHAQEDVKNTLDYGRLSGLALNQDIKTILRELDSATVLSVEDKNFKSKYENRFKFDADKTDYFVRKDTSLNPINRIYQDYWRKSLIDNSHNFDNIFLDDLLTFLRQENRKSRFTSLKIQNKSIGLVQKDYIQAKGFHSTGFGKTGSLYDLLVWKSDVDTTYKVDLINDTAEVIVHFMTGFISLGWEEYATFGVYYPGGWTTSTALYCVKEAYDVKNEFFLNSYLRHEGQHFSDMMHYPKLVQKDLEYRAKLTELCFADNSLYALIGFWISSAKYDLNNAHPFANYCVIRDLSRLIFGTDFQSDSNKWTQIPKKNINNAAKKLYMQNSAKLDSIGRDVVSTF